MLEKVRMDCKVISHRLFASKDVGEHLQVKFFGLVLSSDTVQSNLDILNEKKKEIIEFLITTD